MRIALCLLFLLTPPAVAKEKFRGRVKSMTGKQRQIAYVQHSSRMRSLATVSPGTSYGERESNFDIGFVAGMNMGYGAVNPSKSGATRNAIAASFIFNVPIGNGFSVAPEMGYTQRGVQTELYAFAATSIAGVVQLDTLDFPLMFRYSFDLGGAKLFSMAGPYASILLNRSIQVAGLVEMDLGNRFKNFDGGMMFGGGVDVPFSRRTSFLGMLRYTYGMVNIDGSGNEFYTRGIQTLFGVEMRF
jgi:hypothetical protein